MISIFSLQPFFVFNAPWVVNGTDYFSKNERHTGRSEIFSLILKHTRVMKYGNEGNEYRFLDSARNDGLIAGDYQL